MTDSYSNAGTVLGTIGQEKVTTTDAQQKQPAQAYDFSKHTVESPVGNGDSSNSLRQLREDDNDENARRGRSTSQRPAAFRSPSGVDLFGSMEDLTVSFMKTSINDPRESNKPAELTLNAKGSEVQKTTNEIPVKSEEKEEVSPVSSSHAGTSGNERPGRRVHRSQSSRAGSVASSSVSKSKDIPELELTVKSLMKPVFTPQKSTKPPTRPKFELPGEKFSRRNQAMLEEKLRQEQEELKRRRAFKAAKPRFSSSPSIAVKENAASRARTSSRDGESRQAPSPRPRPSSSVTSMRNRSVRPTSVDVGTRNPQAGSPTSPSKRMSL
ncbi:hypothetical protein KEM55_000489, partial [Ascosphaera atra]